MEEFYQAGDLANKIGVSRGTIINWIREGKLPSPMGKTIGRGDRLWTQAQVDEIMARVRSGELKPERIM